MSSSIPAARTNLVAILEGLTGAGEPLEGVYVARTGIWKDTPESDRVVVLNAQRIEREPRSGTPQWAESYIIPVECRTFQPGDDIEDVETRLWELVTAVEQAVLANERLGGAVSYTLLEGFTDGERSGPADANSVYAEATLEVRVGARPALS